MHTTESQHGSDGMSQLVGEGFDHFDILVEVSVHHGKHNGICGKPKKPMVVAALVIAKLFLQVANMVR